MLSCINTATCSSRQTLLVSSAGKRGSTISRVVREVGDIRHDVSRRGRRMRLTVAASRLKTLNLARLLQQVGEKVASKLLEAFASLGLRFQLSEKIFIRVLTVA